MNIESELPENFDQLSDDEKVRELESLLEKIDDGSGSGALKKRMVEELIREYRS
ncbi:MAG: hypothetical protein ABEJ99_00775 [Candidatus Nanohaloarchaea archaeon]